MISTYITKASFQPFDEIYESNHRSMHIDINLKHYIHESKLNNKISSSQTLNSKHPKNVKAYKDLIMEEL